MIVPYVVAYSLMFGSIISWGIMWPLISNKAGDWYPAGLQDGDFRGLFGYKVGPGVLLPCWQPCHQACVQRVAISLRSKISSR